MQTIKTTASIRIRCSERARRINGQRVSTLPLLEDLQVDPRSIIVVVAVAAAAAVAIASSKSWADLIASSPESPVPSPWPTAA